MNTTKEPEGLILRLVRESLITKLTERRGQIVAFYDERATEFSRVEELYRKQLSVTPRWRMLRKASLRDGIDKAVHRRSKDASLVGYYTWPIDAAVSMLRLSSESTVEIGADFYRGLVKGPEGTDALD